MNKCECDSLYCTACYPLYTPEETRAYYLGTRHLYVRNYIEDLEISKQLETNPIEIKNIIKKLKNLNEKYKNQVN